MKYLSSLALGLFGLINIALAQQIPTLDFFHGRECPHCHKEKAWFPELKKAYPDIIINEYEIWHDPANQALMQSRLTAIGGESTGVPTNIIKDQVVVGFSPERILALLAQNYGPPAVDLSAQDASAADEPKDLTWLWIVLAGLGLAGIVALAGKKS